MGLDWELTAPARRGKAKELRELRARLAGMRRGGAPEALVARAARGIGELEVDPFELLTAPRIGVDDAATAWLRGLWREGKFGKETWTALSKRTHGQVVLALVEPADAVPLVSGRAAGALDYRGQQLVFAEEIIGAKLLEEAWSDHSPREMVDYATRLSRAAAGYRKKHPRPAKKSRDLLAIVEAAARWLRFWGERGFSFRAWF